MTGATLPALQIRHADGEDWCVAATWADGRVEEIAGFKSEVDANDWIASGFPAWLEERQKADAAAAPYQRNLEKEQRDAR
jgi:hypothetical protein